MDVWSRKDEWEVGSGLSLSSLRVLYSNVNGNIRHGVHRSWKGGGLLGISVSVCVLMYVCVAEWEFHMGITPVLEREKTCVCERDGDDDSVRSLFVMYMGVLLHVSM